MLFLEAAAQVAAQAARAVTGEGGEKAAEAAPAFHTGSLLHPLYANHILTERGVGLI